MSDVRKTARNFHLPLPGELYDMLREEAEAEGRPATALAREALEVWIRNVRKQRLRNQIAAYASEMAGTEADLDEGPEAAALENLNRDAPS